MSSNISGRGIERKSSNRTSSAFGLPDFMSQAKFKDPENGSAEFMPSNISGRGIERNCFSHIGHHISLVRFKDPKMGYLVDDAVVVEAEVQALAIKGPNVIGYED
ncbi:hypothetical protein TIFTF001_056032 [Ficus carica]|uniref:Uncharacterized protein n=1 Tax=Ficus carica TaxID=3494 RepID=A0AA88EDF9_FICCA|nr:hypothetical protein TIFTF001_056032 [Ficus carica]